MAFSLSVRHQLWLHNVASNLASSRQHVQICQVRRRRERRSHTRVCERMLAALEGDANTKQLKSYRILFSFPGIIIFFFARNI